MINLELVFQFQQTKNWLSAPKWKFLIDTTFFVGPEQTGDLVIETNKTKNQEVRFLEETYESEAKEMTKQLKKA